MYWYLSLDLLLIHQGLRTEGPFCCFSFGSLFLKAWNCLDRMMLSSSLSASFMGFCLPCNRKICITFDMEPLTVPSASVLNCKSENLPLLTATANAPRKRILSCLLRLSMKMFWHPTKRQQYSHLAQAQEWNQPRVDLAGKQRYLELCWHLLWEVETKCWGEFFAIRVPVPIECVCDVVQFSGEPLTVSFYFCIHEQMSVVVGSVCADCGLKGFFANFVEIWFLHPSFGCCDVGHQEGVVATIHIQGVMMAVRYLSKLLVIQNWRSNGIWKRPAWPWSLYPPSPVGNKSE